MKRKSQSAKTRVTLAAHPDSGSVITQVQIAKHFRVTREYINRIVTGAYENPSFKKRIKEYVWLRIEAGRVCPESLYRNLFGEELP